MPIATTVATTTSPPLAHPLPNPDGPPVPAADPAPHPPKDNGNGNGTVDVDVEGMARDAEHDPPTADAMDVQVAAPPPARTADAMDVDSLLAPSSSLPASSAPSTSLDRPQDQAGSSVASPPPPVPAPSSAPIQPVDAATTVQAGAAASHVSQGEPPNKRPRKMAKQYAGYDVSERKAPTTKILSTAGAAQPPPQWSKEQLKFAIAVVRQMRKSKAAKYFNEPVDADAWNIPHYYEVITEPMDLGTVERKLKNTSDTLGVSAKTAAGPTAGLSRGRIMPDAEHATYPTVETFVDDMRKVWANCYKFNGRDIPVAQDAKALEEMFEKQNRQMPSAPEPLKPSPKPAAQTSPPAAEPPSPASEKKKLRRPSTSLPVIRRSSTDGRPKREIIPPPPKDLPWTVEEPSSSRRAGRRGSAGGKNRSRKLARALSKEQHAEAELKYASAVMHELHKQKHWTYASAFYDPVDHVKMQLFDYPQVIKHPMDLSTIRSKLDRGLYPDGDAFDSDIRLMFNNCYRYNPPGNPVHEAGRTLEKVYDDKWRHRPAWKEPEEEEEEEVEVEVESEEEDDEESERVRRVREMEKELAQIHSKLEMLKKQDLGPSSGKKKDKEKAKGGAKRSSAKGGSGAGADHPGASSSKSAAKAAKSGGVSKRKSGEAGAASAVGGSSSKAAANHAKSSGTGAGGASKKATGGGGKKKAQAQAQQHRDGGEGASSDDEESHPPITYEMKTELAEKITQLEGDRLDKAIRIIHESRPDLKDSSEEIELDIDALAPRTLYKLYSFVVKPRKPRQSKKVHAAAGKGAKNGSANGGGSGDSAGGVGGGGRSNGGNGVAMFGTSDAGALGSLPIDGRKRGTGGLKRKNLDEDEESERIRRLEEQLKSFDNPAALGANANGGGAAARMMALERAIEGYDDDLASTDSSDSGSDDDSDSDSDGSESE